VNLAECLTLEFGRMCFKFCVTSSRSWNLVRDLPPRRTFYAFSSSFMLEIVERNCREKPTERVSTFKTRP